jgi:drug/metabolite transporter (DMT)-like permease
VFLAMGRAVVAACLSLLYLWFTRAAWPSREQWKGLSLVALGVVFGFPLLTSLAMRHVEATHASVITGVLPLATASLAAVMNKQKPSWGFWLCASTGTGLVVGFALLRSGQSGLHLQAADLLLLGAMAFAAVGYAWGGRMSQSMGPEQVICWALVVSLPVTLPLAWFSQPTQAAPWSAWAGFAYVSLFSMWLGFFAWYRGLAMGGTVRVSQIQLLQPFLGMLIAIPVLGEGLDATTVSFGLAVVATVFVSRRMAVQR